MRVLIVDDEVRYRVYLRDKLIDEGHDVSVAADGRTALDHGIGFQPEVLVTDWVLRNHIHGLQVAEALRTVYPATKTIVITSFASRDLKARARSARLGVLEKPFSLDALARAVVSAPRVPAYQQPRVPFGVIRVTRTGLILHASPRATRMLATTAAPHPTKLQEIFGDDLAIPPESWLSDFHKVAPKASNRVRWWVSARATSDGWVIVLLSDRKKSLRFDRTVALLLDRPIPPLAPHGIEPRTIVIDDGPVEHAEYLEEFERRGYVCFKANSRFLALDLLNEDPKINVVVIDAQTEIPELPAFVEKLRRTRRGLELVGAGNGTGDRQPLESVGIRSFMPKPWTLADLLERLDDAGPSAPLRR